MKTQRVNHTSESYIYTLATKTEIPKIKYSYSNSKKSEKDFDLIKHLQGMYTVNYKSLIKEIKEYLNNLRGIPCSWIGKLKVRTHNKKCQSTLPILSLDLMQT